MTSTIWVTGASSGLGHDLALELQNRGRRLALSARSPAPLERLAARHPDTHSYPVDLTQRDQVANTIGMIERDLGPIDTAILNAGTHHPVAGEAFTKDGLDGLMRINLMTTAHCLENLIPRMVARGRGRLVIVASVAGYRGLPTAAYYGATKAALINMAESLHLDLSPHGVMVQLVNPGFVKTPLTDRNSFKMPFLMDSVEAARRLANGIETSRFEIVFPKRFVYLLKLLRILPYGLYFKLVRRITGS